MGGDLTPPDHNVPLICHVAYIPKQIAQIRTLFDGFGSATFALLDRPCAEGLTERMTSPCEVGRVTKETV
ncbi:MAG: hypothetical protein V4739_17675 [Pseudomonadota bacterium]